MNNNFDFIGMTTLAIVAYEFFQRFLEKRKEKKSISLNATRIASHRILITVFKSTPSLGLITEYGFRRRNQKEFIFSLSCETDIAKAHQTLPMQLVGERRIPLDIDSNTEIEAIYVVVNGKKYISEVVPHA